MTDLVQATALAPPGEHGYLTPSPVTARSACPS